MKRYGDFLVRDGAQVKMLTARFSKDSLELSRTNISHAHWRELRHRHRDELAGLIRIETGDRPLPQNGVEQIEVYCAPGNCVYTPRENA
jgi:hypothetical protein